jgi:hypothetical protein
MRGPALALLVALAGSFLAGCSQSPAAPAEVVVQSRPTDEVRSNDTVGAEALAAEPKARGHIAGVVVDEAIRPIAGARVKLPGLDLEHTTDRDGGFGFVDLRPGPYFITVDATGYDPAQTVLDVQEDEFTRAKVILTAIPPPEPYHVTQAFDGFADVVTSNAFLAFGFTCGSCVFDFYVDRPGLRALVVEATAEGAVSGDGFQHWLYGDNGSYGDGLSSGSSGVPMRVELRDGDLGSGDHFSLEVYPTAFPAPETSKRFQVFVTAFYNQPPPTGWSIAEGDA